MAERMVSVREQISRDDNPRVVLIQDLGVDTPPQTRPGLPVDPSTPPAVVTVLTPTAPAASPIPAAPGGLLHWLINDGFHVGGAFVPYGLAIGAALAIWYFTKKK